MRVLLALAAFSLAAPAMATTTTPTTVAPAATAPTSTAPAAMAKFTADTPIETIVADPAAKAVLDASVPGLTTHSMFEQFKSMSLKQLQPMSGGRITDDVLTKAAAALAAVK